MADTPVTLTHELGTGNQYANEMGAGMFGGSWIWIILLFVLFAGGGGGLFGNRANTNTVVGLTNEALLLQLNQNLNTQFALVNDRLCDIRSDIAGVNYNAAINFGNLTHQADINTCAIKSAIHEDGAATRALINDIENQRVRDELLEARNQISNFNQTTNIINALRPYPSPAFLAPNPAVANNGFGYGFDGRW